jgi:hypothetical protein
MINLEIPDPFITTKTKSYSLAKGFQYDYFGQEWSVLCTTCNTILYAPNKYDMLRTHRYHTRNECLGGW